MKFTLAEIERDPKTFFVERIRRQADAEGLIFSGDEHTYLEMARLGRDKEADEILEKIKLEKKFEELDRHLAGLSNRAFQLDINSDPNAIERYRHAIKALASADHGPHLSMFVSQIVFDERFEPERSGLRQIAIIFLVLVLLVLGWWIGTHFR